MIKLSFFILIISLNLDARVNPFEVDSSFNEENKVVLEKPIQIKAPLKSKDDGLRTVKVKSQTSNIKKIIVKKVVLKPIKKKLSKIEIEKLCKTNEIKKVKKVKKVKMIEKAFVPTIYKVLPFLNIEVNKNDIKIVSSKKYRIFRHIKLKTSQKIVIDFTGKTSFYTKSKNINTFAFKSYKVGNHKDENYFRVTIDIKKDLKYYELIMKHNVAHLIYK